MRFKPQSYEKYSDKFLHEFKIVLIFPAPAIARHCARHRDLSFRDIALSVFTCRRNVL